MTRAFLAGMSVGAAALAQPPLFDGELVESVSVSTYLVGADMDGDGQGDLVAWNIFGELGVHLTAPDGRPTPAIKTLTHDMLVFIAVDVTGDGIPDGVYTRRDGSGVMVEPGVGDGTFESGTLVELEGANGLAAIDADQDGDLDLAVGLGPRVDVLLNDGTGQFSPGSQTPVSGFVAAIRVGDIDADGFDDLGVIQAGVPGVLASLLGDGAGGFTVSSMHPVGEANADFALADMNGDGLQDGVVARFTDDDQGFVDVFIGGDKGFGAAISSPIRSEYGFALAIVDADADGHLDVIHVGGPYLELLTGDGTGALSAEIFKVLGELDGGVDAIETNAGTVLGGASAGDLEVRTRVDGVIATRLIETDVDAYAVAMGDIDADGDTDIVLASWSTPALVHVFLQHDGELGEPLAYVIDGGFNPKEIAIGDITGDGVSDIIVGFDHNKGLMMLEGARGGEPLRPKEIIGASNVTSVSLVDWDGDGDLDVVMFGFFFDNRPAVFLNSRGEFDIAVEGLINQFVFGDGQARAADINGDGTLDLVAAAKGVFAFGVNTGGALIDMDSIFLQGLSQDLAVADLNGDGLADAAVATNQGVEVFFNEGGTFTGATVISDQERSDIFAADVDLDGDVDLGVTGEFGASGGSGDFELFINHGGVFESSRFGCSPEAMAIAGGDFDADGDADIVTATIDAYFNADTQVLMIHENLLRCPADFNGDGALNVLDFVAFQLGWQAQAPKADCNADGAYDVLDFVCFQLVFVKGCR